MAEKSSSSKSSSKNGGKTSAGKKAAPAKSTPAKKSSSKSSPAKGKSPASSKAASASKSASTKKTASAGKGSQASRSSPASAQPFRLQRWLTLNRSLDIAGIFSVFLGLVLLLSLLSANNSAVTGGLLAFFRRVFGIGVYVFPFVLLAGGLWLILRKFERIPQLTVPRAAGFTLLYLNFLTWLHFFTAVWIAPDIAAKDLANLGRGGGYVGAFFYSVLEGFLGVGGTAIALVAWLLVAIVLAFDISVVDLFSRFSDAFGRLLNEVEARLTNRRGETHELQPGNSAAGYSAQARPVATQGGPGYPDNFQPYLAPEEVQGGETLTWSLPQLDQILEAGVEVAHDDDHDRQRAHLIEETLASFGAPVRVVEINRGPTITQFGAEPDFIESRSGRTRVRVSKITALSNDLALALSARTIRVEAPVPGKGFVGIEVPNEEIGVVALRDVIESEAFKRLKSPLRFALGQNVSGQAVAADLAAMPHLLIAGQTGSGKSVCVNALISCLLINNTPDDLRLIMVDPKRVELTGYNGIPHLLAPVVVELERVVAALQWVTREMDMRYRKLAEAGSRNIQDYNARMTAAGQKKLPYLVLIIDELADLMMLAPDETERTITRLAQLARATGIHLVIATQRPSVDVVTGLIKANFPARVAFAVASNVDSRVILDQPGAETLLGRGDMLFQAPDSPAAVRLQGVYVSDSEILRLVAFWQSYAGLVTPAPTAIEGTIDSLPSGVPLKQMSFWESGAGESDDDPMLAEAIDLARRQGRASISMLQRRLRIGYTRAARLIETMEERGIVGAPEPGSGARPILDYGPAAPPVDEER
jgi:DNA segregation ATPase FtsK/SpoIIIE, S-DNA-T family